MEQSSRPKALGVFWDIENCNVPSGKSAVAVCERIRAQSFFRDHREIQFAVVCDVTREHKVVLEDLDKAQVDILHVGSNRKNAADDKLKQLMRRFADLHRDGSRIVLISGDMDFAADIADFKRRMFLSVILLHSPNASESLINAASSAHNFQELLASIPSRLEAMPGMTPEETQISVSNLPSVSDYSEEVMRAELNDIGHRHSGTLKSLNCVNGSAVLRFPSLEQATLFKQRFIHHKIGNRSINVHWGPKTTSRGKSPGRQQQQQRSSSRVAAADQQQHQQRSRCKSFSQSPGPGPAAPRSRTYSECERKTSNEHVALSSSQESTGADVVVESLARPSRPRLVSESSLTADVSSGEEVKPRQIRRPPAKIRSRAKLKNRKKSEATTEFLANKTSVVATSEGNRQEQENWKILAEDVVELLEEQPDFCLEVEQLNGLLGGQIGVLGSPSGRLNERDLKNKMVDHVEVRGNLVTLPLSRLSAPLESRLVNLLRDTPSQAIPVEKVEGLYFAAHGSNFQRLLEVQSLPSLPLLIASCPNLAILEPHLQRSTERAPTPPVNKMLTLLTSDLVSAHLRKVTDLVHHLTRERTLQQISVGDLERAWHQKEGRTSSLQLSVLARRSEVTVSAGWVALPDYMKQGYKLVELLTSVGGVAPIATLASQHGPEVRTALAALDRLELLVRRRGGSVMLEELFRQLEGAAVAGGGFNQSEGAATTGGAEGRSSRQEELAGAFPDLVAAIPGRRMSRGLRTVRQEQLFQPKLNKLSLTSFVATEVGRRERGTSLQGEFSETRESGSTGIQAKQMAEREERLGLQARMSSSPPYSPQRSSTPGDIITIDSDAESTKSSTWTPSPRGPEGSRRRSRLAANFSGNEL